MTKVRTPAQAAYEAFIEGAVERMPGDPGSVARLDWDRLADYQHLLWRHVANAAVTSALLCDSLVQIEGFGVAQGSRVIKEGGDYKFEGLVVALFSKRSGAIRLIVENEAGMLMILNPSQVRVVK